MRKQRKKIRKCMNCMEPDPGRITGCKQPTWTTNDRKCGGEKRKRLKEDEVHTGTLSTSVSVLVHAGVAEEKKKMVDRKIGDPV